MYYFEIGPMSEYGFSVNDNQVLLLVPDHCENLTNYDYKTASDALSRRGLELMYLPKLMQSISDDILDYFIPEQAGKALVSYNVVQSKILGELELTLSSPIAVMNVEDTLIGLQSEEEDKDTDEFMRMLLEYLGEGEIEECCIGSVGSALSEMCLDSPSCFDEDNACPMPCAPPPPCSPCGSPGAPLDEEYTMDILIEELKELQESKLRELGLSESALRFILGRITPKLSRLRITRHSKIVLDDYAEREIKLDDKTKALYFLYLRHPEGIAIKDLHDYYNELMDLYQSISGRDNPEAMMQTITNLTDPFQNNVNISLSRIKKAFCDAFTPTLARKYYVEGQRGGLRRVSIDRNLVTWETIR